VVRNIDTQLPNVAFRYARLLDAKVTRGFLTHELEESPYFPTLLALRKVFAQCDIDGNTYNITAADLLRIGKPFLALLRIDDRYNDFVLVTQASASSVSYIYRGARTHTVATTLFNDLFRGAVWIAHPSPSAAEPGYQARLRGERRRTAGKYATRLGAALILGAIVIPVAASPSFMPLLPSLGLMLAGLAIACILLLRSLDERTPLARLFCPVGHKGASCDAVLNSKASRIFGISLAELCFFYFAAAVLILLQPSCAAGYKLWLMLLFSGCSLPFIVFSLYYQGVRLRQWCRLCLSVVAVLLAHFAVLLPMRSQAQPLPLALWYQVVICLLLPVLAWYSVRDVLRRAINYRSFYTEFKRCEHDPDIFNMRLLRQQVLLPGWEHLGINAGNPAATNTIVVVSEPNCGACATAHTALHELITANPTARLQVIFFNDSSDSVSGNSIARYLVAAAGQYDPAAILHHWYTARDINALRYKYPVPDAMLDAVAPKLDEMSAWCLSADIRQTPSIFVNGYMLPDNYSPADLSYFF
jgi:uncharacterized membrane protein